MNQIRDNFQHLFQNPVLLWSVLLLLVILLVVISILCVALYRRWHTAWSANSTLAIVILSSMLLVIAVNPLFRWQWIVGLLPTFLVGYQVFFLWLYSPKWIDRGTGKDFNDSRERESQRSETHHPNEEESIKRAEDSIKGQFGIRTLFIRYGLPAVLLGITGIIIMDIVVQPDKFFSLQEFRNPHADKILRGIQLGSVGAFMYVLLELGRRTFRHDITGASAMWCLVTLVLGPVLAAAVAILWRLDGSDTNGWSGSGVVLFFAGFAPRRVISAIEKAALQLLKPDGNIVVETRLTPLSKIRGISLQIEERLGEEGILDVNSLAAAEPIRLVRNTSFDLRQILTWIDEAILMVTLPKSWEAFEELGITGAIDLAWYFDQLFDEQGNLLTPPPDQIRDLADKGKLGNPSHLVTTIRRLYEDRQVQYIWALYNNFTEYSGDGDAEKPEDSSKGSIFPVKSENITN
jgi:hypothetical protein